MYELDSNRQMKDSLDKGWLFIPWVGEVSVKISRIRHHDFIWDFMQFISIRRIPVMHVLRQHEVRNLTEWHISGQIHLKNKTWNKQTNKQTNKRNSEEWKLFVIWILGLRLNFDPQNWHFEHRKPRVERGKGDWARVREKGSRHRFAKWFNMLEAALAMKGLRVIPELEPRTSRVHQPRFQTFFVRNSDWR